FYDARQVFPHKRVYFYFYSLSIILLGIDVFLPTTSTISVHTTSLMPFVAFSSSIILSISELSSSIVSTLRSMVCCPMLLPTYITSSHFNNILPIKSVLPLSIEIKKSTLCQPNFEWSSVDVERRNSFSRRLRLR